MMTIIAIITTIDINIMTTKTGMTTTTTTVLAMAMTNHIIPPGLTLMAGWQTPANDNRQLPPPISRH